MSGGFIGLDTGNRRQFSRRAGMTIHKRVRHNSGQRQGQLLSKCYSCYGIFANRSRRQARARGALARQAGLLLPQYQAGSSSKSVRTRFGQRLSSVSKLGKRESECRGLAEQMQEFLEFFTRAVGRKKHTPRVEQTKRVQR
jgi:hypothetical protein